MDFHNFTLGANTMKRLMSTLIAVAVVLNSGLAYGQDASPPSEHLKPFGPMIGTWRYEGPMLEAIPGFAEKEDQCVVQASWRWILDKKAVMEDWSITMEGGKKLSGKALDGWNAADKKIVQGGMDSTGGMGLGTVVFDAQAKTCTVTSEGVDDKGEKMTAKIVFTLVDKDTLTWQALEQSGTGAEGPSAVITFKRVPRAKGRKAGK